MNRKTFKVIVEQEIEITLDMDKYNEETSSHVSDYWGFSGDEESFLEDLIDFIACQYVKDGYFDPNIEGVATDGHSGEVKYINIDIEEKRG